VWQFDLANRLISIGWSQLGDISQLSRQELEQAVASNYQERPPQTKSLITNMLWNFYHEISLGDVIIARRGRSSLAGVGTVSQLAFYANQRNPNIDHSHFLGVSWLASPRDKEFDHIVFPMHTLSELTPENAEALIRDDNQKLAVDEIQDSNDDLQSFVLERYLENFIIDNFVAIFGGRLIIYQDADGNDGQQYTTDIGSIDILALDNDNNGFVVIELKKGRPSDQVVGQILRYMGWVKRNLCAEGQMVRGLVICQEPDERLSYALEMISCIDVRYYSISFTLRETY
jgi:restriction system protein